MENQNDIPGSNQVKDNFLTVGIDQIKNWARLKSPWAIHYNSGSCNGCDIELLSVTTPRFDSERFGVKLQGSPRHSDILIVTGAVTRQSKDRLIRTYEQMPEPKFVMVLGSCGISGGVFHDCYCVLGGVDKVIPVDVYVPGCPPRPEAIINGLVTLLNKIQNKSDMSSEFDKPTLIIKSPVIQGNQNDTISQNNKNETTDGKVN